MTCFANIHYQTEAWISFANILFRPKHGPLCKYSLHTKAGTCFTDIHYQTKAENSIKAKEGTCFANIHYHASKDLFCKYPASYQGSGLFLNTCIQTRVENSFANIHYSLSGHSRSFLQILTTRAKEKYSLS